MKVTPLAQGTGVPAQSESSIGRTADAGKMARAKAIAAGQDAPQEQPQSSGDPQVDRITTKRIKMRTQQSTNRHEVPVVEEINPQSNSQPVDKIPTDDTAVKVEGEEATKPIDPQLADLVRIKRALQVKERELAQREEAFKVQAGSVPAEDLKAKLKADPLGVLQEAGVTYDQLTEAILNNQNAPIDPQKLRNEIKEDLKKELLGEFGTRDQQAETQVLGEINREVVNLTAQGDQYEAIRTAKAQKKVTDLIHRTWKETGEVMDVTEAAELVENQLIEDYTPFAKLKKVQSLLAPEQSAPVDKQVQPPRPGVKVMRTLTNRDNASPVMDRRSRAIAAMNGTLRKG